MSVYYKICLLKYDDEMMDLLSYGLCFIYSVYMNCVRWGCYGWARKWGVNTSIPFYFFMKRITSEIAYFGGQSSVVGYFKKNMFGFSQFLYPLWCPGFFLLIELVCTCFILCLAVHSDADRMHMRWSVLSHSLQRMISFAWRLEWMLLASGSLLGAEVPTDR